MPSLYLPKSDSYIHFVHPLEDVKQYSNPIASQTLSVTSAKTTSIIPLSRLDFTLSFLLNPSPTTFALLEYQTNHSSTSKKPLLILRSTHTSNSSQLGKYFPILHCFTLGKLSIQLLLPRSCLDNSCISKGARRYRDFATDVASGTKSIRNSTCRCDGHR
ncbi:hypothetical protein Tco_1431961 [Tanacetum coccineum]